IEFFRHVVRDGHSGGDSHPSLTYSADGILYYDMYDGNNSLDLRLRRKSCFFTARECLSAKYITGWQILSLYFFGEQRG
ncbi:MAG: hypothetical protein ACOX3R_15470, partial [Desulfitobacteriia bacterium]